MISYKDTRKQTGNDGENRAADFLVEKGYRIIERNFRYRRGEVDIFAMTGETLVAVEVKALPNGNAEILAAELGKTKQKRIIETTKYFLSKHREYSNSLIRFDAVIIDMPGFEPVYHIQNAFAECV